jgi:16S rRNA (cytosine1402-N4)-methyltransferase
MEDSPAHTPVLLDEVLCLLAPAGRSVLMDCTVGAGGHAEALLEAAGPQAALLGIDRDGGALTMARRRLERFGGRVRLFEANFSDASAVLAAAGVAQVDLLLADLGISSWQLDDPHRGLSFQADGPLDMRMSPGGGRTAADLVNGLAEAQLADLIYEYGEERFSRRIGRAIVLERAKKRIERTGELARIVSGAVPAPARAARRGVHPATRTFQALRIAVNDELGSLDRLLKNLRDLLAVGGRAGIISFHSLEDRRVKQAFREWAQCGTAAVATRKPATAGEEERLRNPRSRSAKLRVIERTA